MKLSLVAQAIARMIPLGIASLYGFLGNCTFAQVTPDGTLGTQVDGNFVITGGTPVNTNLFHSFSSFSIPDGQTAQFLNDPTIVNIFGRVTGGTPSSIQGTIQAQGTANLFLINPNGIIFGPNARLDISGSFVGTTASAVRFGDGGEFSMTSAVDPAGAVLRVNPSALFFNQTPGSIINQSIAPNPIDPNLKDGLRVPDGQNLFLVGGDVRLENGGTVRALGGRIELGGLAGTGEVKIEELITGSNPLLNFPDVRLTFPDGVPRSNVSLTTGAIVDVVALGGGDIAINAQNIDVAGGSFVCAGLGTGSSSCNTPSSTFGSDNPEAGNILLSATGAVNISQSQIENNVNPGAVGNANNVFFDVLIRSNLFGSIVIETGSLSLTDDAQVSTSTFGTGSAGLVLIQAKDSITLAGENTRISSRVESGATGNAGGILIQAGSLSLTDVARIDSSTSGVGNAGSVAVEVKGAVSLTDNASLVSNVEPEGVGDAGDFLLEAKSISLNNTVLTTQLRGQGNTGDIILQANDGSISLNNSRILSTVEPGGVGEGGNILIQTNDSVKLSDPASFIGSTVTEGATGKGGDVVIETDKLIAQDGGQIFTSTLGEGQGGNLTIKTSTPLETGQLVVQNGAQLTVSGQGAGDAGDLRIIADSIYMDNQGRISTATASGNSANIFIDVKNSIILRRDSDIRTDARGTGNGGNITIEAGDFILGFLSENSDIIASAYQGRGGNITATADDVFGFKLYQNVDTPESDFTASSELGIDGRVIINTRTSSLEAPSLNDFSEKEIVQSCKRRGDENQDEFFVVGRGGLPLSPNNILQNEAVITNWVTIDSNAENNTAPNPVTSENSIPQHPQPLVEAQGWIVNQKGEIVLTAKPPTVTPNESGFEQLNCDTSSNYSTNSSAKNMF